MLPSASGERHAVEIAEMSLQLLDLVSKFELLHKKGEKLQVRIGLHSGTCVAGELHEPSHIATEHSL